MKLFTEGNGYICIKTVQKSKSDTIMKTTHCPKTIIAMSGMRALMLLPLALMLTSIILGMEEYNSTKEAMRQDLTRALRRFVMDESQQRLLTHSMATLHEDMVLTLNDPDQYFCAQLTIPSLKDTSHVSVCLLRHNGRDSFREKAFVYSDTLLLHSSQQESGDAVIAFKAYANPSFCSVLGHSDQRLSITGLILCLLMLSVILWRVRMSGKGIETAVAYTQPLKSEIHLTPMQEQLMSMFASAPDHILSKETICATLWPKKEHPENTLYTFISRLKVTLKDQSDIDIVNIRGKEYKLVNPSKNT